MATDDNDWRRAVERATDRHDAAMSSLWPDEKPFRDAVPPEANGRPLPAGVAARATQANT